MSREKHRSPPTWMEDEDEKPTGPAPAPQVPGAISAVTDGQRPESNVLKRRAPPTVGPQSSGYVNAGATSSVYANQGPACNANALAHPKDCYLEADVRERLAMLFNGRVRFAQSEYLRACTELKIEQLLKPSSKEEIPFIVNLIMDVITGYLGRTLGAALTRLRSGGMNALAEVGSDLLISAPDVPNWATASFELLGTVKPKHIEANVKRGVDIGKKLAMSEAKKPDGPAKSETLGFIARLERAAAEGFETIAEQAPAYANDAELVTLFDSFKGADHTAEMYKQALTDKIARYMNSGVTKLGIKRLTRGDDAGLGSQDARLREPARSNDSRDEGRTPQGLREKKVVLVVYASGAQKHYGYAHRDWGPNATPRDQPPSANFDMVPARDEESRTFAPYFGGKVPDEFVEAALARHQAVWGDAPKPLFVDESDLWFEYVAEPERILKAAQNLKKNLDSLPPWVQQQMGRKTAAPKAEPAQDAVPPSFKVASKQDEVKWYE